MKHWSQFEEKGIIWGMRLLVNIYQFFGRKILQLFLYPVVSYFWLLNKQQRKASLQYLKRISNYRPINFGYFGSYLHFISFANAIIDKLTAWSGSINPNDIEFEGRTELLENINKGQGLLILGSHLGNLEVSRVIAHLINKVTVNVLIHTKHAEKFNTLLSRYAKESALNLIQVTELNSATAIMLQDKIEAGEIVLIAADRTPINGQKRVSQAEFLGDLAYFPQGPFILALLLKCPVYSMFCLKHHDKYVIYFEHFRDRLIVSKKHRTAVIQQCVEDYAARLQSYCLKEPLQWFNFYDFWWTEDEET